MNRYGYELGKNGVGNVFVDHFKGNHGKKFQLKGIEYYDNNGNGTKTFMIYAELGNYGEVNRIENGIAFCTAGNGYTKYHNFKYDSTYAENKEDNVYKDNVYIIDYYTNFADTAWDLYYRYGSYMYFYVANGILSANLRYI